MKQTRSSRYRERAKNGNRQSREVHAEAVSMLRTVSAQEAFYFYEAIGKPTGEVARNLRDLLDKVKSAKTESLAFHLHRNDFQNWVGKTLGDAKLAEKLGGIHGSNGDEIRKSIRNAVENRIKELSVSTAAIHVDNTSLLIPART
jgi:hypothetical protein